MKRYALILVLLAACGGGGHTIHGSITAPECGGGYEITNAPVEVHNESNKLIGTAQTGPDKSLVTTQCMAQFTVELSEDAKFYKIKVGTHDGPSYTAAELAANDYTVALTLGG